eukprot:scaffold236506_cov16-Tisochrysis_lutea.AAC.1
MVAVVNDSAANCKGAGEIIEPETRILMKGKLSTLPATLDNLGIYNCNILLLYPAVTYYTASLPKGCA